jgi:hypothetical protein
MLKLSGGINRNSGKKDKVNIMNLILRRALAQSIITFLARMV